MRPNNPIRRVVIARDKGCAYPNVECKANTNPDHRICGLFVGALNAKKGVFADGVEVNPSVCFENKTSKINLHRNRKVTFANVGLPTLAKVTLRFRHYIFM